MPASCDRQGLVIQNPVSPGFFSPDLNDEQFLLRAFRSFSAAAGSLERSYAQLQTEVARLRRELEDTQGKLRREQALAEVAAVLAHEIRNPLGSLELFAGMLGETALEAEPRQWVEQVQAGLRTLAATVNNVLHFHSPEPALATVDLGELLEWSRDFFVPLMRQSQIKLRLSHSLRNVLIFANRFRLEQVLQNLVLNAVRAAPTGGWIEIVGHATPSYVSIIVADSGPGITTENLASIFEPGFTTRAGSPGLGLAVCRRIVEQHGGTITAENLAGAGAALTVTLPLARQCSQGCGATCSTKREVA
jgi:two-component system, sensor histidine kinase FlrB